MSSRRQRGARHKVGMKRDAIGFSTRDSEYIGRYVKVPNVAQLQTQT